MVFGQVVSGIEVIRAIARVPTDIYDHPRIPVTIFDCGQIDESGKAVQHLPDSNLVNSNLEKGTDAVH